MFDFRCSLAADSMSRSMSFWPSTIATRSSSAWVALNNMRFMRESLTARWRTQGAKDEAAGGAKPRPAVKRYAAAGRSTTQAADCHRGRGNGRAQLDRVIAASSAYERGATKSISSWLDLASNAAQCHRFVPASRRGAGLRQSFQDRYFLPAPRRPVSDLTGIPRSNAGSARL